MYDNNDKAVILLALSPDGTLREIIADAGDDMLEAMYTAMDCRAVDVIRLPRNVDMWIDDEGLFVETPAQNRFAGALIDLLSVDRVGQIVVGTVVLASMRRGATVSLDDDTRAFVLGLVLSFGGRLAPTMRPVPMGGGRAWEWEYHGVQFRAESGNGSALVRLHFRTDAPDSEWTVSHDRDTEGASAKRVAEDMYRDTTGVAL